MKNSGSVSVHAAGSVEIALLDMALFGFGNRNFCIAKGVHGFDEIDSASWPASASRRFKATTVERSAYETPDQIEMIPGVGQSGTIFPAGD
ncbi:MAG: hypothetical protein R2932_57120 [Caldilineaceae bacterium]